jgi:hypothetical protein
MSRCEPRVCYVNVYDSLMGHLYLGYMQCNQLHYQLFSLLSTLFLVESLLLQRLLDLRVAKFDV